ncbi:HAMP domain-containing sensor histidine kinase [Devosia sp. FKR38]|uniref:sensor histidine kinase n=1 Tax=Devosia sp. FKR38 TaxID=2562312 RepID=UPI0010C1016D|nr:HAMP domain-containing sensor histidine kinase [Devosia sp. FKR38]
MVADWITSPSARRVQQHAADPRPAWLWSQDGQSLIWSNPAAALFLAKLKKHGLKRAQPAVPIKGQVSRNIRLGSPGRTSLARIQFQAGDKPASGTCATTPLTWENGQIALLIVGVDPIDAEIIAAAGVQTDSQESHADAGEGSDLAQNAPDDGSPMEHFEQAEDLSAWSEAAEAVSGSPAEPEDASAPAPHIEGLIAEDEAAYARELESWRMAELAGQSPMPVDDGPADGVALVPSMDSDGTDDDRADQPDEAWSDGDADETAPTETIDTPEIAAPQDRTEPTHSPAPRDERETADSAVAEPARSSRLSALLDRLVADEDLYTPLTADDDHPPVAPVARDQADTDLAADADAAAPEPDETALDAPIEAAADEPAVEVADAPVVLPAATGLFRVTGHGFRPLAPEADATAPLEDLAEIEASAEAEDQADLARMDRAGEPVEPEATPLAEENASPASAQTLDTEVVERVSRYNFDELSRILNDRVADIGMPPAVPTTPTGTSATASLVNLGGETLVLNRLPLGILVFRDQQILFANRAITDMVGYESVEKLRAAGLAAVFPAAGPDGQEAGPINHLVQRDGTLVPVTARLQSMSWQGRPALMLSASATEVRTGHESAVSAFAQSLADIVGDGFFEATRSGVVKAITPKAVALLEQTGPVDGKPLTALIAAEDVPALRSFLDRPARFAETERPWLALRSAAGGSSITLFTQGQAGVVTGYFGFVRARTAPQLRLSATPDADPALLGRISRGVRRPLNTIIGFADMLHAAGPEIDAERLADYARDISHAGQDIAALVDELEDYARLRDGRYLPQRATIELTELLEGCVLRIRQHASNGRVLVRNAISETLPRLTADRASLEQAVLNLLASAIDQTPAGGAVVISAQRTDEGGIAVHVRDSSSHNVDMGERFVVFRDGMGRNGQALTPVRSSVGLALTRSLLAVNAFSLSVDPAGEHGMLFTLTIPADLVAVPGTDEQNS